MNRKNLFLLLLLALVVGCHDDDNESEAMPGMNQYRMYGINYDLSSGILWHEIPGNVVELKTEVFYDNYWDSWTTSDGKDTTAFFRDTVEVPSADVMDKVTGKFVISLYGHNVTFNEEESKTFGRSNVLTFHLSVPDDEFETGKYVFATTNEPHTFYGFACSDYDFNKMAGPANPIDTGVLNVTRTGDIFEIEFDCLTSSRQPLKGSYRGVLRMVDNRKNSIVEVKDMVLEGLPDTAYTYQFWYNPPVFEAAPYDTHTKFMGIASTGLSFGFYSGYYYIKDKKMVDLAYCNYYKTRDKYSFISPVSARVYLAHYFTPMNHTKFINDVASSGINFTVADFDKLTKADGAVFRPFDIVPDNKVISVDAPLPRLVLFQNSQGMKGAIKIKEVVPIHMVEKEFINENNYQVVKKVVPGGGYVKFDVKMQKNASFESIK